MTLTTEQFEYIEKSVDKFNAERGFYEVDYGEVVYSYFKSTPEKFMLLNDWDEGSDNDPWWDKELNEHSVIVFIKSIVKELNQFAA
jgi:hypothetical protein